MVYIDFMDLKQADLGLLLALDALLECESVTLAARRLGLSQPAMSAQLARLRRLFGDPLLVASGRRLVASARAEGLKTPLREALEGLDVLVREGRQFSPATTNAQFRLIGSDFVQAVLGPPLQARLAATAPRSQLAFLPFAPREVWASLEAGSADTALATGLALPDAKRRRGLEEDFVAAQRPGHPRGQGPWSLETFCAAEHLLVSPEGGGFVGAADRVLARLGHRRRVACSLPNFLLAPPMIAASDLIGLLPRRLARLAGDRIEAYELPFPSPRFQIDLLWHPRLHGDPAQVWFRRQVLDSLESL